MFEPLLSFLSIAAQEGKEVIVSLLKGLLVGSKREDIINVTQVLGLERNADGKSGKGVRKWSLRRGCEFEEGKGEESCLGKFEYVHDDYIIRLIVNNHGNCYMNSIIS